MLNYEEVITPLGASEKFHYLCSGATLEIKLKIKIR